ncbi:MAG: hypothetical protein ACI9YM_001800 [Brevundimonas sp.]|jgi:hypothetical protein|uniref:hypothetical protein n=1 Tax=Brevundimonas sp. TaxID=1871086 RepID=UPI0039E473C7
MLLIAILAASISAQVEQLPWPVQRQQDAGPVASEAELSEADVIVSPDYSIAYELVAGRTKTAFPNQTSMIFFDSESHYGISARRDQRGLSEWGFYEVSSCDFGDYCIAILDLPQPIVLFSEPQPSFDYDGWHYSVINADMSETTCNLYSAKQIRGIEEFRYLHCSGGIVSISVGGETRDVYELRSFFGLGSGIAIPFRP